MIGIARWLFVLEMMSPLPATLPPYEQDCAAYGACYSTNPEQCFDACGNPIDNTISTYDVIDWPLIEKCVEKSVWQNCGVSCGDETITLTYRNPQVDWDAVRQCVKDNGQTR